MSGGARRGKVGDEYALDVLVKGGYVSARAAEKVRQKTGSGNSVVESLLGEEMITPDVLGQALAESFGVEYADLNSNMPTKEQIRSLPEELAKDRRVVFFRESDEVVVLATDDPAQQGIDEAIREVGWEKPVALAYSLSEDIDEALRAYDAELGARFAQIVEEGELLAPQVVAEIIRDAISVKASDIHFEPSDKDVVVRFRIDDVLHVAGRLPRKLYVTVVNRIKVLAHLRTDEHAAAQDGSLRFELEDGNKVDIRVSIAPVMDGEKIALRILSSYVRSFTLGDLGLTENDQKRLMQAAKLPFGMILVTGPTGSGKTTTLYAAIKKLNNPEVNITTIEDPVEYRLAGVNHIQVNTQTGLTFAKGLRTIVRQDPNIILVGEIRDNETAEISVNAALTGHLLLSTFHSNDAATAIPRLLDMQVEPFLLASTLELVVAQRLVRRICEACRVSVPTDEALNDGYDEHIRAHFESVDTLYQGKGCHACKDTGFRGRVAIFEIIRVTPEMENLILKNPSSQEVNELARAQGTASLFEDGLEKVKQGQTTMAELMRVARPQG